MGHCRLTVGPPRSSPSSSEHATNILTLAAHRCCRSPGARTRWPRASAQSPIATSPLALAAGTLNCDVLVLVCLSTSLPQRRAKVAGAKSQTKPESFKPPHRINLGPGSGLHSVPVSVACCLRLSGAYLPARPSTLHLGQGRQGPMMDLQDSGWCAYCSAHLTLFSGACGLGVLSWLCICDVMLAFGDFRFGLGHCDRVLAGCSSSGA